MDRRAIWAVVPLTLVVATVGLWPPPATACGACLCQEKLDFVSPPSGTDLPPNARIFVRAEGVPAESLQLVRAPDVPIAITREPGPIADSWWLIPEAPLLPGSTVNVVGSPLAPFYRVADDPDGQAPPAPEVLVTGASGGVCGLGLRARIHITNLEAATSLVHLTVETEEGTREVVFPPSTNGEGHHLGTSEDDLRCLGFGELETTDTSLRVTARVYDAAGRPSLEVTFPVTLQHSAPGGCGPYGPFGCSTAGAMPLAVASLLSLMLVRRRGQRPG